MPRSALPLLALIGIAALSQQPPARADTTTAYCQLSRHDHTIALESGPCQFSQRQGNVDVRMGKRWAFHFPADQQGKSYQRSNSEQGLRFTREGDYTLSVVWRHSLQCPGSPEPVSVAATPPDTKLPIGDPHAALTVNGARYTAPGVDLWEHQGTTRIDWLGQVISCR